MSNLYKNFQLLKTGEQIRVINSDQIIEKKMNQLSSLLKEVDSIELKDRINLDDEQLISISTSEQKDNTDELLQANETANEILVEAQEKANGIYEAAKTKGFEEGLVKAKKQLEVEYLDKAKQLQEEVDKQKKQLEQDYQVKFSNLEPVLLDKLLTILEKSFGIYLDDKKQIILHLVKTAMLNIEASKEFQIRVSEPQRIFLENHKIEIMKKVGSDVVISIVSDPVLLEDQCIIETESGVFDCSLEVQLTNLIKDLKALCL